MVLTFNVAVIGNGKKNNLEVKPNKSNFNREKKRKGKEMISLGSFFLFQKNNKLNTMSLDQLCKQYCIAWVHFLCRKEACRPVAMATLASAEEPAPLRAEPLENSTINRVTNSSPIPNNTQGK